MSTHTIDDAEHQWCRSTVRNIRDYMSSMIVGQPQLSQALLVGVLSGGHVLLESLPGLAKTLAASTMAHAFDASFARIQCTPDLLPSDIIGTEVFDPATTTFRTELGPVHANFVLLDEINRSSAKTQSAMLEAMQEHQTTIAGRCHRLPDPFMVMATQNPIEEEGTYVLPQAQMDRFLLKEVIDYPSAQDELEVLSRIESGALAAAPPAVATVGDIHRLRRAASSIHVDESIKRYIVEIVGVTRHPEDHLNGDKARHIEHGASPRGTIAFLTAARARALLEGRTHAIPDDVIELRHSVLRHRIIPTFEALADGVRIEDLIDAVFTSVPTP